MILQIIPANGWLAVFVNEEAGELETVPLCTWALVKQEDMGETYRFVQGFTAVDMVDPCDEVCNFLGYIHASDPEGPQKYREEAERYLRRREKRKAA